MMPERGREYGNCRTSEWVCVQCMSAEGLRLASQVNSAGPFWQNWDPMTCCRHNTTQAPGGQAPPSIHASSLPLLFSSIVPDVVIDRNVCAQPSRWCASAMSCRSTHAHAHPRPRPASFHTRGSSPGSSRRQQRRCVGQTAAWHHEAQDSARRPTPFGKSKIPHTLGGRGSCGVGGRPAFE